MTEQSSYREDVVINLEHGLHLVPCSKIAELARRHDCEVRIIKEETVVDAKAVFDLMTLRAEQGSELTIETEGPAAHSALRELTDLFANDFYVDRSA